MGANLDDARTEHTNHLANDPSAKSIFQLAYSQKSEKQGLGAFGQHQEGAPQSQLQMNVAQTMKKLQGGAMDNRRELRQRHFAQNALQNGKLNSIRADDEEPEI